VIGEKPFHAVDIVMASKVLKSLRQLLADEADEVVIIESGVPYYLEEGKWLKGQFDREMRVDRNTHMRTGEKHAHIYDRKGNQLYSLTQNGKPSHNSKPFRLSNQQADALRAAGFDVGPNNMVEAVLVGGTQLIFG
jgi:hypothetical protein